MADLVAWDTMVDGVGPVVAEGAANAERNGYDGVFVPELAHDPFISAAGAISATESIAVGTQIAVAFARSPMTVAQSARDLQELAQGRFILGLGTQVSAHITRRFSMPWSHPARRMTEYLDAVRAIWASWRSGERLQFDGEFYTHTLMSPQFVPADAGYSDPPIWLAAVGPLMAKVAGSRADGIVLHGFCTARYAREVIVPAVEEGLRASDRSRADFTVTVPLMTISAADAHGRELARAAARRQVAFYASTPAYREVMALDGWGVVADELHELSRSARASRWDEMSALITDDILDAFAVEAAPEALPAVAAARFGGVADRIALATPSGIGGPEWRRALLGSRSA